MLVSQIFRYHGRNPVSGYFIVAGIKRSSSVPVTPMYTSEDIRAQLCVYEISVGGVSGPVEDVCQLYEDMPKNNRTSVDQRCTFSTG